MPGMTTSAVSPVATALLAATVGVAAWTMTHRPAGFSRPPALAAGCQLATNAATVYMLPAM